MRLAENLGRLCPLLQVLSIDLYFHHTPFDPVDRILASSEIN